MALVNTADMMIGPGKLRYAPVGTDDALIVATYTPNWTSWTEVGATDGGVQMSIAKDYANHSIDQVADWVASTITERHTTVQTSVVEAGNLAKLALVNNGGTTTPSFNPSWAKYEPTTDLIVTQETYISVALEGVTLAGKKRIIVARRVLNVDSVSWEHKKDGKTMYGLSFAGHYVSDTVAPFVVYSQL
jgi:hypothetical protein